ncbi:MAG: hypothetical protein HC908_03730 [Calothrix sp. SM1_7_51]|nr:hypothetical protein [Calothrix sp. SM1_7_51]
MTKGNEPNNQGTTPEENVSRHAVTKRLACYQMEAKYGWRLLRIEANGDKILKFDCVFQGETEFPNYVED